MDNNNILKPAPVSTRQFTWDPISRIFSAEISDTNGFGRVYADACDEGLTLVSARTGREVVCAVDSTDVVDGEIVSWALKPVVGSCNRSFSVLLFND